MYLTDGTWFYSHVPTSDSLWNVDQDELRERVKRERRLRGWSVRRAATESDKNPNIGGISNTTWGQYEKAGVLSDTIRVAISIAFGWPRDWPVNAPATPPEDEGARIAHLIVQLDERLADLQRQGEKQAAAVEDLARRDSERAAALADLERQLDALNPPPDPPAKPTRRTNR
jgi:transcriptional regulator with XRE-family HTH domain